MVDFTLAAKIRKIKDLTAQLNEAIRDAATDPVAVDEGNIKIEVETLSVETIGVRYPYPILDVKVSRIQHL